MKIKQDKQLEVEDEFNVTRKVSALGFTKLELSTKQRLYVKNEDEFNVTRKVSALGFTKLELSTKQRLHVKNAVEYEQHDATIVKTFVQYDTEVDIKVAHIWDHDISSGSTN